MLSKGASHETTSCTDRTCVRPLPLSGQRDRPHQPPPLRLRGGQEEARPQEGQEEEGS